MKDEWEGGWGAVGGLETAHRKGVFIFSIPQTFKARPKDAGVIRRRAVSTNSTIDFSSNDRLRINHKNIMNKVPGKQISPDVIFGPGLLRSASSS